MNHHQVSGHRSARHKHFPLLGWGTQQAELVGTAYELSGKGTVLFLMGWRRVVEGGASGPTGA